MAKFCGHCGAPLLEGAICCGQCGTPVDAPGAAPAVYAPPKKKSKAPIVIAAVAAVVVVAVIVAVAAKLILGGGGAGGTLKKVMTAYLDEDVDALVDLASITLIENYDDGATETDAEAYFEYMIDDHLGYLKDEVGSKCDFSYEITEDRNLKGQDYEKHMEDMEEAYPEFDTDIIDKVYEAEIEVTATEGREDESIDILVTLAREKGEWKVTRIVRDGSITTA